MRRKLHLLLALCCVCSLFGQTPNDCDYALLVCGNTSFGLEPAGVGFDEFSLPGNTIPPCYSFGNNTIWLRFVIAESGQFTFDLIPESDQADYDFAIYGPNVDCKNLGEAIRCSSTNPQSAGVPALTGLNLTETDHFEGPGEDGNGYLQYMDVLAGEEYYMVIDRPHGSGAFDMDMTGSAVLPDQPVAHDVPDLTTCENDGTIDGFALFDLDPLIPEIIQAQTNVSVTFHKSLNDANIGQNPLSSPFMNTSNPMTVYYRVVNASTNCFDINELVLTVESTFEVTLPQDIFICDNSGEPVTLSTQPGYAFYEWSTGESGANAFSIEIHRGGDYWVVVTDNEGCQSRASTTILSSNAATITELVVEDFRGQENTITVQIEGPGDYQFLLDELLPYQDENIFRGVTPGYHTVYVRDKKGCGTVSAEVVVLDYPKFFTPNGDGVNDLWQIEGIWEFPNSSILIYDRYGRIINGIKLNSGGWDGRDQNGVMLAANDYWFVITLQDGREIRGHFTLKR